MSAFMKSLLQQSLQREHHETPLLLKSFPQPPLDPQRTSRLRASVSCVSVAKQAGHTQWDVAAPVCGTLPFLRLTSVLLLSRSDKAASSPCATGPTCPAVCTW